MRESTSAFPIGELGQLQYYMVAAPEKPSSPLNARTVLAPSRFIRTKGPEGNRIVSARQLPRTVLSTTNAAEAPTALVARREMQSWRLLQFEPTALRAPDPYRSANRIEANGAHIPATLARLARKGHNSDVYAAVSNRLA